MATYYLFNYSLATIIMLPEIEQQYVFLYSSEQNLIFLFCILLPMCGVPYLQLFETVIYLLDLHVRIILISRDTE